MFTNPRHIRNAAFVVMSVSVVIALVAMVVSYRTLAEFLVKNQMEHWAAWTVPATVDLLALCAMVAHALIPKGRPGYRLSFWTTVFVLVASGVANVYGAPTPIAGLGHAWPLVAYVLAEHLGTKLLAYAMTLAPSPTVIDTAKQVAATEVKADDAQAPDLPEAPVSPAPAPATDPIAEFTRKHGRPPSQRHARRLAGKL